MGWRGDLSSRRPIFRVPEVPSQTELEGLGNAVHPPSARPETDPASLVQTSAKRVVESGVFKPRDPSQSRESRRPSTLPDVLDVCFSGISTKEVEAMTCEAKWL